MGPRLLWFFSSKYDFELVYFIIISLCFQKCDIYILEKKILIIFLLFKKGYGTTPDHCGLFADITQCTWYDE